MAESLNIIFSSFWTWGGTIVLILAFGNALALPFYWYYRLKQQQLTKSYWELTGKYN